MKETYTPPTILVVEEDDEVRPVLSQNLRHQGYHVVVALNEADAIERTKGVYRVYTSLDQPQVAAFRPVRLSSAERGKSTSNVSEEDLCLYGRRIDRKRIWLGNHRRDQLIRMQKRTCSKNNR